MVQQLGLHAYNARGMDSPGQGSKIPQAVWVAQTQKKQKENTEILIQKIECLVLYHKQKSRFYTPTAGLKWQGCKMAGLFLLK